MQIHDSDLYRYRLPIHFFCADACSQMILLLRIGSRIGFEVMGRKGKSVNGDGDGGRKNEGGLGGSGEDYLLDPAVEISLLMLLAHLLINKHQVTQFTDLLSLNSVHQIYVPL